MKTSLLTLLFVLVGIACVPTGSTTLPSCQSGPDHKATAPDAGVVFSLRIATDTCVEDRDHVYGDGTYATLDCRGDGGTLRIEVPRKEWLDMKRDGIGSVSPGPGK